MGKSYFDNCPIIEAVCEFRFAPSLEWDMTIFGKLDSILGSEYPRREDILHVQMSNQTQDISQRMRFLREDETGLIHAGDRMVSINWLKGYKTWEEFLPRIENGFEAYKKVTNAEKIARIGLRYMNVIEVDKHDFLSKNYDNFVPNNVPDGFGYFTMRVDIPFEGTTDTLRLMSRLHPPSAEDRYAVMLDMDYIIEDEIPAEWEVLAAHLNRAHDRVYDQFMSSLTPELKKLLGERTG